MLIDEYDYELPDNAVAQSAIEPRHDSRLLIASDLSETPFHRLSSLLREGDLIVVNRTRVRAARLSGRRVPSGGRVEVLLTRRVDEERWEALLRPSRRLKRGSIVKAGVISVELLSDPSGGVSNVSLTSSEEIESAIAAAGEVPLPPYFHGSLDSPERYQTLFAKRLGSSAAPTAALHFTPHVVEELTRAGVEIAEVELEVGLDTFRPMGEGLVANHVIHSERIVVDDEIVNAVARTRERGGRVIAVGTTVVRTLESVAAGGGRIAPYDGDTELFITPGYGFAVIDAVITNFHAPRTSLVVMIAAMVGERWREIYDHALDSGFRFLSFGDAMYIEVERCL